MKIKFAYIFLLHLWALSLVGSPMTWLLLPEENVSIMLNNGWEEESGETDVEFSDLDKLFTIDSLLTSYFVDFVKPQISEYTLSGSCIHIMDVVLPPPEKPLT